MQSGLMPFHEAWLEGPLSTQFYTRLYRPPPETPVRAVLVFAHGYLEHIGRTGYTSIHARWASLGVAVFAWDERGFGRTALDKDNKSAGSSYGRTGGMRERMLDMEWAILHARSLFDDAIPIFLMGHSMAGGMALGFATRQESPPENTTIKLLSGVIASSPLIRVAKKAPSPAVMLVLNLASKLTPNLTVATTVQDKDLSRDPTIGENALKDPWIKPVGTMRGVADMINRGSLLLSDGYKQWPSGLPVLILHGTEDMVNAYPPTKEFAEKLEASDKEFIVYQGAWHDLMSEPDLKEKYFQDLVSWVEKHLP